MPQAISKFTMVNTDTTTKEYCEQSDIMRHLVVIPVLNPEWKELFETGYKNLLKIYAHSKKNTRT